MKLTKKNLEAFLQSASNATNGSNPYPLQVPVSLLLIALILLVSHMDLLPSGNKALLFSLPLLTSLKNIMPIISVCNR